MTMVADVDLSTWNRYPSSPRLRGSDPFGANLISVGQAVESNLAQSIAGGDVVAAYTPSADSRLIYVSATGDDGTGASTTIAAQTDAFDPQGTVLPYLTLAAATAQVRSGYADWVLLKRGDTWTGETTPFITGRSNTERSVVTYYGTTGARPVLKMARSSVVNSWWTTSNIVVYGLDFYAHTRDPAAPEYTVDSAGEPAFRLVGGGDNITFDETIIRFFRGGIVLQSSGGLEYTNFTIKRCMVLDSYGSPATGHVQGMYVDGVDGCVLEDNLFDYNGWHSDISAAWATQYNHNVYMQTSNVGNNVTVNNNIFSRGASHGLQGRAGGLFNDNLMVNNSIGFDGGYTGFPIANGTELMFKDNVILDGKLMDLLEIYTEDTFAVWGIHIEANALDLGGTVVLQNNIIANRKDDSVSTTAIDTPAGTTETANAIYAWNVGEDMTDVLWTHPSAGVTDYMTNIGETATEAAFYTMLRSRPLNVFTNKYSATSANNYFRAGFNR